MVSGFTREEVSAAIEEATVEEKSKGEEGSDAVAVTLVGWLRENDMLSPGSIG